MAHSGLSNMSGMGAQLPASSPSSAGASSSLPPAGVVAVAALQPQQSQASHSSSAHSMHNAQNVHVAIHQRNGEQIYNSMDKINSELLAMTYGAMVTQLIKDYKDVKVVNVELEKMGYNIGVRLVDEFLAKSNLQSCVNFRETAQVIAKVAFKMFLGITAEVTRWREDGRQFSLVFKSNPLGEFVELPQELHDLDYSALICGALRGALHMLQMSVECQIVKEEVKGAPESEMRVTLKEIMVENYNDEEEQ